MKSQILIPREGAVLRLVCEGLLNKQIAGKLGIAKERQNSIGRAECENWELHR